MLSLFKWAAAFAVIVALGGCTIAPIQNVENASVTTIANKPLTPEQVRAAIVRAGSGLGWIMKDASPGQLTGTIALRTHTAEVSIPYSATSYSIGYKSSTNLNEGSGKIHRNYNGWILNLTRAINAQLAAS